jgi:hypothetical protein
MRSIASAAAILIGSTLGALAADPAYLDDRSAPEALVRSLYNAIERREYARAWSYFAEKPGESLQAFGEGFADTDTVIVQTGVTAEEGAAGTTHYYLPVAIEARTADGDAQVYGGCYEMRLANPQLQGEDFAPLQIVGGTLSPSTDGIDAAMPATCTDGAAPDPSLLTAQRARKAYESGLAGLCTIGEPEKSDPANATNWKFTYGYSYSAADEPKQEATLFRFLCNRGAYNESHVYLLADAYGGIKPLGFATPELDIRYEDNDFEKPVEAMYIKGYRSAAELVNSQFDPATLTLTSHANWRGLGDASAIGTWIFRDGEFALVRYDVDATYDGEIQHEIVVDFLSGP